MDKMNLNPTLTEMNQLETAVLMEKYVCILGMLNYGTAEQKEKGKRELHELTTYIHQHVNGAAFEMAKKKLNLSEEDEELIEKVEL
jgi:hypothetical protein